MQIADDDDLVYVLGAGFSCAVSREMLVTSALADRVQEALEDRGVGIPSRHATLFGADFEAWLTYLIGEQPWLSRSENLRNHALFYDASEEIARVITHRQNSGLSAPMPDWLRTLVAWWATHSSTVMTFNYDTLVEKAAGEVLEEEGTKFHPANLRPIPVQPLGLRQAGVWAPKKQEAFTLLKLHGSLDWLYSGAPDFFGEPLLDLGLELGWQPDEDDVVDKAPDKMPLIVPPTAGKNAYMANETVRAQWRLAQDAIARCRRIVLIGYSLPPTDEMVRWMLSSAHVSVPDERRVIVVNPDGSIAERVADLTISRESPTHYASIEAFVADLAG